MKHVPQSLDYGSRPTNRLLLCRDVSMSRLVPPSLLLQHLMRRLAVAILQQLSWRWISWTSTNACLLLSQCCDTCILMPSLPSSNR